MVYCGRWGFVKGGYIVIIKGGLFLRVCVVSYGEKIGGIKIITKAANKIINSPLEPILMNCDCKHNQFVNTVVTFNIAMWRMFVLVIVCYLTRHFKVTGI